jgi:hypothetical protein
VDDIRTKFNEDRYIVQAILRFSLRNCNDSNVGIMNRN